MAIKSITRISTNADGVEGIGYSDHPVFSPDGSKLAFSIHAFNLVPSDTNGRSDIFVVKLADACVSPPPASTWPITPESARVGEADGTVKFTVSRLNFMLAQIVYVSTGGNQRAANECDCVTSWRAQ
jgi:hypothetical protein